MDKKLNLFGSYASGNPTPKRDIDFIIKKGDLTGTQYFSLLKDLENAFDCRIDLITTGFSNREFLNRIEKDKILLYER